MTNPKHTPMCLLCGADVEEVPTRPSGISAMLQDSFKEYNRRALLTMPCGCWASPGGIDGKHWRFCKLHAAAPEMLAALKSVLAWFEAIEQHQHDLLAAGGPSFKPPAQAFEDACKNWKAATKYPPLDFAPIRAAIDKAERRTE